MFAVRVENRFAEEVRRCLATKNLVDNTHKIRIDGKYVEIPIVRKLKRTEVAGFRGYPLGVIKLETIENRILQPTPFEEISRETNLPKSQSKHLPRKWELIGDVLILKIPDKLRSVEKRVGEVYASVVGAKTVLIDSCDIRGTTREPTTRTIYGNDTETTHIENKVRFKLDVAKIMFSSGNIHERERMAYVSNRNETVADMFAGIGYFSIPIAVHSKPKRIYTAEINPTAYGYLCTNIRLNKVANVVIPLLGDCRKEMPENIADRVIMGYLHDTWKFLPKAVRVIGKNGGIIHYHEKCHDKLIKNRSMDLLKLIHKESGQKPILLKLHNIKSYSPHISHIVMDILVKKR
ncbi:MAG: class I SAM-dependent methyltransferase family protein [Thermoplasmata archaeon]